MIADTIDNVLIHLDTVIEDAKATPSRLGFFPAVYRQVTARVKQGIEENFFDNGPRMDSYTTQFANRYLAALAAYQNGQTLSRSWKDAFENTNQSDLLIIQHILLGMNAHINLDLAVVTAELSDSHSLNDLKADFNRINDILERVLDEIQGKIGRFSPLFNVLDKVGGRNDEAIANFSIKKARKAAWVKAKLLVELPPGQQQATINAIDREVAFLGRLVAEPGGILGKAVDVISWIENDNIPDIIDGLS